MAAKVKRPLIKSPIGTMKYGWITQPNTKWDEAGKYTVDLVLDPADPGVKEFKAQLEAEAQKALADAQAKEPAKAKVIARFALHCPIKDETDAETGEPTGKYLLRVSESASFEDKKTGKIVERKIDILDAKLRHLKNPKIGRGTKMRVAFTLNPFLSAGNKMVGVSTYFKAVQIIELVEFNGGTFGFGEEEGYEGSDEPQDAGDTDTGAAQPDGENAGKDAGDF